MPPDQKAIPICSIWLLMVPAITQVHSVLVCACSATNCSPTHQARHAFCREKNTAAPRSPANREPRGCSRKALQAEAQDHETDLRQLASYGWTSEGLGRSAIRERTFLPPHEMPSDLRLLPTASKATQIVQRPPNEEQAAANSVARALGCRVIERRWPAWSRADTLEMLVRWTLVVEDRRGYLGRPLRKDPGTLRSDWADCERALRVPFAHLMYNARRHGLPTPATLAKADDEPHSTSRNGETTAS